MKKKLLSLVCVLLLVVGAVFGTYAYLTAQDSVTNTFTVGKVGLDLDEAYVDEYGRPLTEDGVVADKGDTIHRVHDGNDYKLMPGHTYVKDPTVTVTKNSEESYVRMIVTVNDINKLKEAIPAKDVVDNDGNVVIKGHEEFYAGDVFLLQYLCTGWNEGTWVFVEDAAKNVNGVYEFRYHKSVNTLPAAGATDGADLTLEPLFTNIVVPDFVENAGLEKLAGVEIDVVAHAIQADGFETAAEAWAEF